MRLIFIALITCAVQPLWAERLLVAMDDTQRDHLKSYGLAFWTLERGIPVEWLLNYRGGAFLYDYHELIAIEAQQQKDSNWQKAEMWGARLKSTSSLASH